MSTTRFRLTRRRALIAPLVAGCLAVAAAPALATTAKTPTDVAIAKTSDRATYQPGEAIAYTITVTNTGGTSVWRAGIVVSDPQIPDLVLVGGTGGDWLAPGESLVYTGERTATTDDCGRVANTATVALQGGKKTGQPDADASNDSATHHVDVAGEACAPPPVAVIALAKPVPAPAPSGAREAAPQDERVCPPPKLGARVTGPSKLVAGELGRFTIHVRNARGHAAARRAHLSVRLPSGFALATPVKASMMRGGAMRWALGTIGPRRGSSVSLTLRADRATSGGRALSATVSAACGSARAEVRVRVAQAVETQVRPAVAG